MLPGHDACSNVMPNAACGCPGQVKGYHGHAVVCHEMPCICVSGRALNLAGVGRGVGKA